MTRLYTLLFLSLGLVTIGAAAQAACSAEYKAKRDNPFELHYDVAQISGPCTLENAEAQLSQMLASQGLVLLKVLSVTES